MAAGAPDLGATSYLARRDLLSLARANASPREEYWFRMKAARVVWLLIVLVAASTYLNLQTAKSPDVYSGDTPDYLTTAYHLAREHVFSRDLRARLGPASAGNPDIRCFSLG